MCCGIADYLKSKFEKPSLPHNISNICYAKICTPTCLDIQDELIIGTSQIMPKIKMKKEK